MKKKMNCSQSLKVVTLACLLLLVAIPLRVGVKAKEVYQPSQIIVSLGDSYASGEGILDFYGQEKELTKKVKDPDWLAHRSKKSWSGQLRLPFVKGKMSDHHRKETHWYFVASSGAETKHLSTRQKKPYSKRQNLLKKYQDVAWLDPQLKVFDRLEELGQKADYVTLSIGGNDLGFEEIVRSAMGRSSYIQPNNAVDLIEKALSKFEGTGGLKEKIGKAYKDIEKKAGKQAQIIVVGYPRLLDGATGVVGLNREEIQAINMGAIKLNIALKSVVGKCQEDKMNIHFVDVVNAFEGHGAYTDQPFINPAILVSRSEDLEDFQLASAYSFHPNEKGAEVYTRLVQEKINELEAARHQEYIVNNTWRREYDVQVSGEEFLEFFQDGNVVYRTPDYSEDLVWADIQSIEVEGTYTIGSSGHITLRFKESWGAPTVLEFRRISPSEFVLYDPNNPSKDYGYGSYVTDFVPLG